MRAEPPESERSKAKICIVDPPDHPPRPQSRQSSAYNPPNPYYEDVQARAGAQEKQQPRE